MRENRDSKRFDKQWDWMVHSSWSWSWCWRRRAYLERSKVGSSWLFSSSLPRSWWNHSFFLLLLSINLLNSFTCPSPFLSQPRFWCPRNKHHNLDLSHLAHPFDTWTSVLNIFLPTMLFINYYSSHSYV